jgi:hypothetical protein
MALAWSWEALSFFFYLDGRFHRLNTWGRVSLPLVGGRWSHTKNFRVLPTLTAKSTLRNKIPDARRLDVRPRVIERQRTWNETISTTTKIKVIFNL